MLCYYGDDSCSIYHGRCEDVLPAFDWVDHVITDPPYRAHVHSNSIRGNSENGKFANSRLEDLQFAPLTDDLRVFTSNQCARLSRRWSLIFSDVEDGHLWRERLVDSGLEYIRSGAWIKLGATPQMSGDRPAVGFELITIAHQPGRKRWNGGGHHAVWTHPTAHKAGDRVAHTTQKPESLMRELIELFTDPGDVILDPFMGSGTTLVAAKRLGRRAIGIDNRESCCATAAARLSQSTLDLFQPEEPSERQETFL